MSNRHPSQNDPESFAFKVVLIMVLCGLGVVCFAFKMGGWF